MKYKIATTASTVVWWARMILALPGLFKLSWLVHAAGEDMREWYDLADQIRAATRLPWPLSSLERWSEEYLRSKDREAAEFLESVKDHSIWWAWRLAPLAGLDVGKTRRLIEAGRFDLLKYLVEAGGKKGSR